jgi:zinc transport system substrate-binding protein
VLHVATGLYPLAQAASLIGGSKASVSDVVPPGTNPLTYQPAGTNAAALHDAKLVVMARPGFQSGLDAKLGPAPKARVVWLASANRSDPYFWLNPSTMSQAVDSLASAMEAADPQAAPLFKENTSGVEAQISSLGSDFWSSFSVCPKTVFFTEDSAFSQMAAEFGLTDRVIGSANPANVADEVRAAGSGTVFSEPWIDDADVTAIATQAHLKLRMLDTLAGIPAGGWPPHSTYFNLMERDLSVLTPSLGCPTSNGQ